MSEPTRTENSSPQRRIEAEHEAARLTAESVIAARAAAARESETPPPAPVVTREEEPTS